MSSLQVGSGVRARFCNNNCPGGEGSSYEVVGPYNLNELDIANNKMDNMQCWTYDETDLTDARVSLFGKADFACPYCGVFKQGTYSTAQLSSGHIQGPGLTYACKGIIIPDGLSAILYTGDSQTGGSLELHGPASIDLSAYPAFYDNCASLEVIETPPFSVKGYWK